DGERLLVTSQGGNVVHSFDSEGNYLGVFAPAGGADTSIMSNLRGMTFHPDTGDLLVAVGATSGANPNTVARFDDAGNYLGNFIDNGAGGITGPWSIEFRESDVLISASSGNIYSYDHEGNFLSLWNDPIAFPQQLQELENGNVLAGAFSAPSGVWELDASGNQIAIYNPVTGNRGVWELPNGNILTTNSGGIHEVSRDNA